jgi:hypothetical protein
MSSETSDVLADSYFDWAQALFMPAKLALCTIIVGGVASRGILHYWLILSGFLVSFVCVAAVPLSLIVGYINRPCVSISKGVIRIAPQSGLVKGWAFPISSMRWRRFGNDELVLYPFDYFAFVMSAGMKPFRIRLRILEADIDKWTTALEGN